MAMAMIPETGDEAEARTTFRLRPEIIQHIEFVARGDLEGESGLKSVTAFGIDVAAGVPKQSAAAMHQAELISDEDELFDRIGDYLANGFTFAEVADIVQHDAGDVHLLALERASDRALGVGACNADASPPTWKARGVHRSHARARATFAALRSTPAGRLAANVLHVAYGWPDPFIRTLPADAQTAFGREFAGLARYTDSVEVKRQELVRLEALRRGSASSSGLTTLRRARDLRAWADSVISSADALRAALAGPRARREDETRETYREHIQGPAKRARDAFISAVRIDANRMLSQASQAFDDAWRRS